MVKTSKTYSRGRTNIRKCKKKTQHRYEKSKKRQRPIKNYVNTIKNVERRGKRTQLLDIRCDHVIRVESTTGVNYYNKTKFKPTSEKRMVIIDGSNVAFAYTNHTKFSPEGIDIAVRFFDKKGHETKVVIPDFRINEPSAENIMGRLKVENKLILTPTKNLPGNRSSSYDDRFILQVAVEFDAAIISNDNYRDLINESSEFRKVIESRVIGYVFCKDMFMVPIDPYGRAGPKLEDILNRKN